MTFLPVRKHRCGKVSTHEHDIAHRQQLAEMRRSVALHVDRKEAARSLGRSGQMQGCMSVPRVEVDPDAVSSRIIIGSNRQNELIPHHPYCSKSDNSIKWAARSSSVISSAKGEWMMVLELACPLLTTTWLTAVPDVAL